MTKREWLKSVINGEKDLPVPQHWMSFFNGYTAERLSPHDCHYENMWIFDSPKQFDFSGISIPSLDRMIKFNNYTGRCFTCLGKGANIAFGHGGPGEFFTRCIETNDEYRIIQYETGVQAKIQFKPHYYHLFNHPVNSIKDIENLSLPDPSNPARYKALEENIKYLKSKGEFVCVSLNGFFSGIHYFFIEYQQTLMTLLLEPALIEACLERLGNWNLAAAERIIVAGADCILICDDLGSKQNLLMSPQQYRQFIKPWHKKLCRLAHSRGALVHLHSHGAISKLLGDLADCGFDIINPFDPEEGFDIEDVLNNYSSRFVVCGGLPASFWELTPDARNDILSKNAALAEKYGRFIFMDSGGIPENVLSEDFKCVLKFSRIVRKISGTDCCV